MMRRRRFPRAGRPFQLQPLGAQARQALNRAHRLLANGDYTASAEILENLARAASNLGMPRRAANLFLQAGRARALGGEKTVGLALIQEGLEIFAAAGFWDALHRRGVYAVQELNRLGFSDMGRQVQGWLDAALAGHPANPLPRPGQIEEQLLRLPLHCPSCGANVHPDEVEWIDNSRAECAYCGSMLEPVE